MSDRLVRERWRAGWAGGRGSFTWSHGMPGVEGDTVGGTCVGVREGWSARKGKDVTDPRGWGRFAGVRLHGKGGWSVVVVVVYAAVVGECGGSMWQTQLAEMGQLREQGKKMEKDPLAQLRVDLMEVVRREGGGKTHMVVGGDVNLACRREKLVGEKRQEWDRWSSGMREAGMVAKHTEGWGSKGGMWSFQRGVEAAVCETWVDWVWVSEGACRGEGVAGLGMS
jgi:hypothetical protein